MKLSVHFGLLTLISSAIAQNGNGPYAPGGYRVDSSLPSHTIYSPGSGNPGLLPVFIWGNGACSADGTSAQNYLKQIASYGYLVISQGTPGKSGSTTAAQMKQAVDWAAAGGKGAFAGKVNTKQIMTAGYSCGGTEAYNFINDNRVSSIGIFNSGLLGNYDQAKQIRKPIIFALGGPNDIAYPNGERDYNNLPSGTPAWKGNLNRVGHGGTYGEANGGAFAKATVQWLNWVFKGDASGKTYLLGGTAADGWNNAVNKGLDNLKVPVSAN
ncbi:beta xylanase [Colletotrichum incanum]|uniref:Beta xylanase n=1 Tax=Colletotrichum incanum TaxID=1573173 RepID=A0A161YBD3_COLIC|nr:beta xylanase [Colletotrichum incanum]